MKTWILSISLCFVLLSVTGCGLFSPDPDPRFQKNTPEIVVDKARSIANAAKTDENFTVNPVAVNNQPADFKTINTDKLFDAPTQTSEERFARLEDNVQRISDTLKKMSPKITKLIGVESELDNLTFQLEELINKGKMDNLSATAPTNAGEQSMQSVSAVAGDSTIQELRVGEHPDKFRVVFEVDRKLNYQATMNNTGNSMTVSFEKGGLTPNAANKLESIVKKTNFIRSISQNKNEDTLELTFQFTNSTQKIKDFYIPSNATNKNHRIVIDLAL